MSLARQAEPGSLTQEAMNQTCCSLLKRPLSVSICHVENDPIAVTFARVYAELQLSGGIFRSARRLKCLTGARSHGGLHRTSFLPSRITFLPNLETNLNYSVP